MAVTLKDIAQKTNLSVTTVSLILNNKPCRVSDETRRRILNTAKEMNYMPNQMAVALASRQTNTIGLLIPDISNHYYSNLAFGVDKVMHEHNKSILLINTNYDSDRIQQGLQQLLSRGVDAVILTAASITPKNRSFYESQIKGFDVPVITVGHHYPDLNLSSVQLNNCRGAFIAVEHLIKNGHKKIACITGPKHSFVSMERNEGYCMACRDYGISIPDEYAFCGNFLMEGGYSAAFSILEKKEFTAVFAFNDVMALGAYKALREQGMRVPEDISLVGFDNIDFASLMEVPLTTVNQPACQIGEEAARQILFEIENPEIEKKSITFEPQLIIRKSTRKI